MAISIKVTSEAVLISAIRAAADQDIESLRRLWQLAQDAAAFARGFEKAEWQAAATSIESSVVKVSKAA
jgi:hypothetical protein